MDRVTMATRRQASACVDKAGPDFENAQMITATGSQLVRAGIWVVSLHTLAQVTQANTDQIILFISQ